jgi:hypothetical protein
LLSLHELRINERLLINSKPAVKHNRASGIFRAPGFVSMAFLCHRNLSQTPDKMAGSAFPQFSPRSKGSWNMANSDHELMALVTAILQRDAGRVAQMLAASPGLATASFRTGASRAVEKPYFIAQIGRYIYAGDTALHIAAAAYQAQIVEQLIKAGADVRARNRFGYNPLHAAAAGSPRSQSWNPAIQATTIRALIKAGADPNSTDKRDVTPMHIAVRTRCALAVQSLLECGADPTRRNKNGSDAMVLAVNTTGRGGSGSPEAKREQRQIVHLLSQAGLRGAGPIEDKEGNS